MRFQGENCTLSFGLYFDGEQVLLNGTVWLRRPSGQLREPQRSRIRFSRQFSEVDILNLQRWLVAGTTEAFALPAPLLHITRRHTPDDAHSTKFDIVMRIEHAPSWWEWDTKLPLTIQLDVRPNEFVYLTNTLNREHWSMNLTW